MEKRLQRIPHEGAIAGVCAGLGAYFAVDKTWFRLAFVISVFFSGYIGLGLLGPIVYIVLWIVLPVKVFSLPKDPFDVDYRAPQNPETAGDAYNYTSGYGWNPMDKPAGRLPKDRYIAGLILLSVGLFFLLHQLGVFRWHDFARYWPVLLIIMGIGSIVSAFNDKKPTVPHEQEHGHQQQPESPSDDDSAHSYTK
ncbi:PspC domain-containing protein [Parapedobacter sp. ISTM3]|uniref:Phage shock protein C (PspC) family protein n=1 Tax=Parapedobacter luteus TaxID=623280 RepID=A0A1T4ZXH1_9SPHI|nr:MULTISPECIES: PspC domain-containing protein [Parapedobacter]MBK1438740.1 PspC domain-containing protein [Parapedobacter sp. ISTM3]SKB27189.1 phage shock protein C (PspC) family protein [Parapedobacter luteus]